MSNLKRTKVGVFDIKNSITIEQLESNKNNQEFLNNNIISIEKFFKNCNSIILNDKKLDLFLNGVNLTYKLDNQICKIYNKDNTFIGLGEVKDNLLKRDIVI